MNTEQKRNNSNFEGENKQTKNNLQLFATAANGVEGRIAAAELFEIKFVDEMEPVVLLNDGPDGLLGVELTIALLVLWDGCWLNTDDIVKFVDVCPPIEVFKLASLARTAVGLTTG